MSKISLLHSIPLGIGSIIGSGILFLPSLTFKVSGNDVLLAWILIILLCIPGMFFFNQMVGRLKTENTSISGMIELGLGREVGVSVHLILLGTVIFGMPSAAIVAGSYFVEVFNLPYSGVIVPVLLIGFAVLVNYFGLKASALISTLISASLILVSTFLITKTAQPLDSYVGLRPDFKLNNIYSGAVLSFWAFAGFENLTFLYHRFNNPKRDLLITIAVSVFVCGLLYLGLVANYSAIVPYVSIKQNVGLIQMVDYKQESNLPLIIAGFALLAVGINLISWTSGVVQLIMQASSQGLLHKRFHQSEKESLVLLGILFFVSLGFGLSSPQIFEKILVMVSSNFLFLYLLLIISYFIVVKSFVGKLFSGAIALSIIITLSTSSYLLLYPFCLFLLSYFRMKQKFRI